MARHGCSGGASVFAVDYADDVFRPHFAAPDVDESADHGSDHVAQEAVGCDHKSPVVTVDPLPVGVGECADLKTK